MPRPDVDSPNVAAPLDDDEPLRKLSVTRLVLLIAVVATAIGFGYHATRKALAGPAPKTAKSWFAPYVDTTLTPVYPFESSASMPARQVALGFVTAVGHDCTPGWGGVYSLDHADQSLSLGARIAQLRINGVQPIASFGGSAHTSLALACKTPEALAAAYQRVVQHYRFRTIDLDIETTTLADQEAVRRNADAIRLLQQSNPGLHVWVTLPVEPSGLQRDAADVVHGLLAARVRLAGVNVMTMDFSRAPNSGETMASLVDAALQTTHAQLSKIFAAHGVSASSREVWSHLGATVMIGQNDAQGQRYTTSDAHALVAFANRTGLARVSMCR